MMYNHAANVSLIDGGLLRLGFHPFHFVNKTNPKACELDSEIDIKRYETHAFLILFNITAFPFITMC